MDKLVLVLEAYAAAVVLTAIFAACILGYVLGRVIP